MIHSPYSRATQYTHTPTLNGHFGPFSWPAEFAINHRGGRCVPVWLCSSIPSCGPASSVNWPFCWNCFLMMWFLTLQLIDLHHPLTSHLHFCFAARGLPILLRNSVMSSLTTCFILWLLHMLSFNPFLLPLTWISPKYSYFVSSTPSPSWSYTHKLVLVSSQKCVPNVHPWADFSKIHHLPSCLLGISI